MGVLNVTPDSFSDGGTHFDPEIAIARGLALVEEGADLVDVGGESTRPGAEPVSRAEELRRVEPVIEALAAQGVAVSVDTAKAAVASRALAAGAVVVNDVTALGDPDMAAVVADYGAGVVLMHMKGEPRTMQADPTYDDVVGEVAAFLAERTAAAVAAGIAEESICLDPGIGFGKTMHHNLMLLSHLDRLDTVRRPVLVGVSRKSTIAKLVGSIDTAALDAGSAAAVALAIAAGAAAVRVHNVAMSLRVARVADAIVRADYSDGTVR